MLPPILKRIFTSKPIIALEIALLLFFGFNVGKQMLKRQAVEDEVRQLEAEIGKLEYERDDLGALISYVQTDLFIRNEARDKLNLVEEGEYVVVIPKVDSAGQAEKGDNDGIYAEEASLLARVVPGKTKNMVRWWRYFFDNDKLWIE